MNPILCLEHIISLSVRQATTASQPKASWPDLAQCTTHLVHKFPDSQETQKLSYAMWQDTYSSCE